MVWAIDWKVDSCLQGSMIARAVIEWCPGGPPVS
jgi:hypothetical protein